jgi:hypothetical protein
MDGLSTVFHTDRAIRVEISNEPAIAAIATVIGIELEQSYK